MLKLFLGNDHSTVINDLMKVVKDWPMLKNLN